MDPANYIKRYSGAAVIVDGNNPRVGFLGNNGVGRKDSIHM